MTQTTSKTLKARRHKRVRAKIQGTAERPRLVVSRSNQHIYAQLIDDTTGKVIASSSDIALKLTKAGVEAAQQVGGDVAKKAIEQKIAKVVFDRGGFKYHGQVAAVAKAAREAGLQF